MSGDYTRFTFDPTSDYLGVFKQQGRVDLDADFNELVEIIDRRWRSETIDVIGHGVVPRVPPGTPPALDPFLVIPTAIGAFDIGMGRMYVDGIQIENHGRPPLSYLPDLGEQRGTVAVAYSDQPYLPAPLPPALASTVNTTDLVYVDVWQREVTVLEDPTLREIALGGPDTTTRLQSVWQVRVLQNVGQHGCGDDLAIWDQTIAPSAGRLSTSAVAPPANDDPCILSPSGGYRGLENRLYRVEVHATGGVGGGAPAKFKWSRNNAHVASSVIAIPSTTEINVQQIGRDQVLRFEVGNWIEITDDFREFQGLTGHMAQISGIDEANRLLRFSPAIPVAMGFNAADPVRHTRVRRWDQSQNVDASGLLDVAAGLIDIEDGICVSFALDPAGGHFKVGDYWVFSARTADGSVEVLSNAPPRGILHHYCRLGFIHWGTTFAGTTFTDCRVRWPPEGECDCCTVTVGDGVDSHGQFTDIQQAINSLGNRGGIVCIGRGFWRVTEGLSLDSTKRNVILRGVGPATRIVFAPGQGASRVFLSIRGTEHVRLENLFVASVGAEALVRIAESQFCRIEDCILVNVPGRPSEQRLAPRAVDLLDSCSHCVIARSSLLAGKVVAATNGVVRELLVRDNLILALQISILVSQGEGVEILHNQMRGLQRDEFDVDPNLSRDTIDKFQLQVSEAFRRPASFAHFQAAGVLIFTGLRVVISQNLITAQIGVLGFLFLNLRVHQNDIVALVGALVIYGVRVKIEDNFALAILVGLIHAGIILDLDCTANEWLGIHGIVMMSLGELGATFAPLLGTALGSADLVTNGPATVNTAATTGTKAAGRLAAFGIAILNKIHRNVFLSFSRGIYKTDSVISADVSMVDNTFSLCTLAAIELGGGGRRASPLTALLNVVALRHLIQGNAIAVRGAGVISSCLFTEVDHNDIQCGNTAVDLDAQFCSVRNNELIGTAEVQAPPDQGLVVLRAGASGVRVAGNRILNGRGHGILLRDKVSDAIIEDNEIERVERFGIGTFGEATELIRTRIARNRVRRCAGEVSNQQQVGGAVVIGQSLDLQFIDNVVSDNRPRPQGERFLLWYAVYLEDATATEVRGNTVSDNVRIAGLQGGIGAMRLHGASGVIRLQNNDLRDNGGTVLEIGEVFRSNQQQQALIQNNHFSLGVDRSGGALFGAAITVSAIESLLFQGNHCSGQRGPTDGSPVLSPVALLATSANVSGNVMVFVGRDTALEVRGSELLVNANSVRAGEQALFVAGSASASAPARVIVTSNITTGISATSTAGIIRIHNFPGP